MPDFDAWMQSSEAIDASQRAVAAWNRINRNSSSVILVRNGVAQSAQTVRISWDNTANKVASDAGTTGLVRGVLFGVANHPSATDTDIQRGDRFAIDGLQYRVVQVITPPGEVQAYFEAIS